MLESRKRGKTVLHSVDGQRAAGICTFSAGSDSLEATVSAQLPSGGQSLVVLQYGPERDYLCRPPAGAAELIKCGEAGVMAVWVLDEGRPALFGQLIPGAFDRDAARKKLPGSPRENHGRPSEIIVKAAAAPTVTTAAPEPEPEPAGHEPTVEETDVPFQSIIRQPGDEPPLLLLKPVDADESTPPPAAPAEAVPEPEAQTSAPTAPEPAAQPMPEHSQKPQQQPWSPLIVKRAPRPMPRAGVYSPLWDDIAPELETMLDTLPRTHPFNGSGIGAQFAEVPTDGAVQCYVGTVEINGLKVFLQAVPARPYARPAGFDHSLVSRAGECFWVKYFIQDN